MTNGGLGPGMNWKGGRHSPFQVLDASAIEGIRGLAGESSSIYSCIQIYKALTPPPPPAPPAYRGATEGPGPPSYVGSSEERPCPDLGLCAPPSAPAGAGAAVEGWAPPPPDDCTCRVKPRLKSPPPPPAGRQTGCRTPVLRGAPLSVCPTRCPAPRAALPRSCACPARPRREGGGGAPRRGPGGGGTTLSLTLALSLIPLTPEQQPLAAPVPAPQNVLQHSAAPDLALQHPAAPDR